MTDTPSSSSPVHLDAEQKAALALFEPPAEGEIESEGEIEGAGTTRTTRAYLDSATYGLPPRTTVESLERAARQWQAGSARWKEDWDLEAEVCRAHVARLFGLVKTGEPDQGPGEREISLMPAVSVASGLVASAVPDGGEVLLAEEDFTSVTFPFLVVAQSGRIRVRSAPVEDLADAVSPETSMVAVSVAQSADGRLADLAGLRQALDRAREQGAAGRLYVDASQALGSLPLDLRALGVDYASCAAYKWLCCPRGVAFFYVREGLWQEPQALTASWRGGDDPYGRYYGTDLALAEDATRFDVSLAWHPWVGARHALDALVTLGDRARFELGNGAARHFTRRLGLETPPAGIVTLSVSDGTAVAAEAERRGLRISARAGGARVSFHFYNTPEQADLAAEVLAPYLP